MNIQDKMQEIHRKYGATEKANYEIQLFVETLLKEQKGQLILSGVSITLPNKDAAICEGYNKAKMQDYKNRNVLRHKNQDDYYSGWMDCYDWISKGN